MANELTVINGVTKKEKDGTFYYFFGETVIQAYPAPTFPRDYYRLELENGQEVQEVEFDDITDKLGATDIEGYLDAVATAGLFSTQATVIGGGGGAVTGNALSAANSTAVLLGVSATFTGAWESVVNYTTVAVAILGTDAAATGTLYFDLSTDGGATVTSVPSPIPDITFDLPHILNVVESHVRIRYVNDATAQTGTFSLQTKYSNGQQMGLLSKMGDTIGANTEGVIVKAVTTGATPDGTYANTQATGLGFSTTSLLGIAGVYSSGVLSLVGYTQVQTMVTADVDGTISVEFLADSAGTDVVRTITIPFTAANGSQMYAAPAFTPYVRYTYTNGAAAQTDFYFDTKFTIQAVSAQILSKRGFVATGMSAALVRNASSPDVDRNLGITGGQRAQRKFGINESVSGGSFEYVTPSGSYTFPTTAETFRIKAGGNANDTAAGTGARTVELTFLDSSWNEVTETLTTAGASASAATSVTGYRIIRARVKTSGTYGGSNIGKIIIENTTALQAVAEVPIERGTTEQVIYTVPAGFTAYITDVFVSVGSSDSATVEIWHRNDSDIFSAPFGGQHKEWGVSDFSGATKFKFDTFLKFEEKSDIYALAKRVTGSGSAIVALDFEFILYQN